MRNTTRLRWGCLAVFLAINSFAAMAKEADVRLFTALRNGDIVTAHTLGADQALVNTPNANGETPLMYAAMYSNAATMRFLISQGAEVNAKTPAGVTALMLAVGEAEKVRLLLQKGADVNARSATGRSALLNAASRSGSVEVVKQLLAAGADPNAKDKLQGIPAIPAGAGGSTPLIEAAKLQDGKPLQCLLANGADVQAKDNSGADALAAAALNGNLDNVRRLLSHGAHVNSKVTMNQLTPLMLSTWRQMPKLTKLLLEAGADPNAQDANGTSALMWSAYSDYAEPETTKVLLDAGAKLDVQNKHGETAMTWARQRGDTAIVHLLLARGAKDEPAPVRLIPAVAAVRPSVDESVTKGIALLQQSSHSFYKVSGCISCHNQSIPQMGIAMARQRGLGVDEASAALTQKEVLSIIKPARLVLLEMSDVVPDVPVTGPYVLLGMAAAGYEPDEYTDAVILNLAGKQAPDGSWRVWSPRPPIEFSPITATALTVRAMRLFGPPAMRAEIDQRIAGARDYLRHCSPRTNEERAMRLLGLSYADASRSDIMGAAGAIVAAQRNDGGWSQLNALESDAYASGQSLFALRTANAIAAADMVYQRGASYLLRTQEKDGSWHVASRSFPFQPYKESGFPHMKDQWISAAGTGWATMALMLDDQPKNIARR